MGRVKESLDIVERVRALHARVGSSRETGRLLGVSQVTVCSVINGWYPHILAFEKKVGKRLAEIEKAPPPERKSRSSLTRRQRMWNSIRIMRLFGISDLVTTAMTDYAGARIYVRHLVLAGIVRVVTPHGNLAGQGARHQLVIDCGPFAPQVRRGGKVFDPNRRREFPVMEESADVQF
jgi:hypothetical protein